ncbi:hypothetical protein PHLGIDRAFT_326563 [Phlebiopsis gigantea 11061_1 CR5-6]|uniref:Uncharacterized protein n=1 Tax=Phlebiopsis gigantea (strain 11061_1 CR5-6) TaxID=745531 RepID=A0A0C3RZG3_PHLG1|nr:hypothetical protein PHLGIDRAFT_326563 [Phlebiopsis gigantea 11061_1 CR5-6]
MLPNQRPNTKQGSSRPSTKRATDARKRGKRGKREDEDVLPPPKRKCTTEPSALRRNFTPLAPPLMGQQRPDTSQLTIEERLASLEDSMWDVKQQIQTIQMGQALIQQNMLHVYDVIDENLSVTEALEAALYNNSNWYNPMDS